MLGICPRNYVIVCLGYCLSARTALVMHQPWFMTYPSYFDL